MKRVFALIVALLASLSVAFAAVNVNTATQAELESLNGIGPAKAKAIIDYRTKNGPFKSLEELDKVPGVGQGTLAKIRNDVTLTGRTTVPDDAKRTEKKSAARASTREPSADDTSKSKATKTPSGGMAKDKPEPKADKKSATSGADTPGASRSTKDKPEPKADKKSATSGADTRGASRSTKESDKKAAEMNEKKSKSLKKGDTKSDASK